MFDVNKTLAELTIAISSSLGVMLRSFMPAAQARKP